MTSLPGAEATTNAIQASARKEPQPTAGNVENIAPSGTQKPENATAECKDASKTRHIDANEETEDSDSDNPEGSDDESDFDTNAEIEDDAPPTWGGYGARAPVKHTIAGPKVKPPPRPITPPENPTGKS
ncbi:hypothetical protein HYPSUDRAFT_45291 [Hypholoma sublateritium FD-334 SS-4]|uniref:Uncharacterized protein n=1 Tax=Hypholoma sublateritium (strain FD-334 SS-4) TaxID=945553 RepID=A0A0D2M5E2_HYPSF|nr:hypothetical protein HYPSUDRAFT_45291 [Hypholoma sublateritium FD-334 SS-4]